MKASMILVAVIGLMGAASVQAEEQRARESVKLERACGSCHSEGALWLTNVEFHRTHPWNVADVRLGMEGQKTEEAIKAPFLGVGVEKVSESLRAQLGLQEGVGMVVNFVEENSPAQAAGVRQHDVLRKLDEQLLVNEEQLVTLVRMRKPGDVATLNLIRGGKPRAVKVQLGEKEMAMWRLNGLENALDLSTTEAVLLEGSMPTTRPAGFMDVKLDSAYVKDLGAWKDYVVLEGLDASDSVLSGYTQMLGRSVSVGPITVDDGSHVVIYTPKDGGVLVAMEKESGTILFNGPVATDEQWRAVPENVKEKMQDLHESFRRGKQQTAKKAGEKK